MESLQDSKWDVVISGTGLKQSLLALSLSRSNLRVLHTDHNPYYGGAEAALSLQEAEAWCEGSSTNHDSPQTIFENASLIATGGSEQGGIGLGPSRAYSLALAPQIIYTQSALIPLLVSSGVHEQLEFLAIGSWWVYDPAPAASSDEQPQLGRLTRVPSSREDIFSDDQINIRHKRALVKFLRFIADYQSEENAPTWQPHASIPFTEFLATQFKVPQSLHPALLALTMSREPPSKVTTTVALAAIYRHLTSMNIFGPGFAAILPKWGGLSEISQVGCRAMAVGGGVYILNQGFQTIQETQNQPGEQSEGEKWKVAIDDENVVSTRFVVGSKSEPTASTRKQSQPQPDDLPAGIVAHSVSVISSALTSLFPSVAEGAPIPAGAVIAFPSGSLKAANDFPVYLIVHSSDTGECPSGQSVIYGSVSVSSSSAADVQYAFDLLHEAVACLLSAVNSDQPTSTPGVLWSMRYTQRFPQPSPISADSFITFNPLSSALILEDNVLDEVREAWKGISGLDVDESQFLKFPKRSSGDDDE